MTDQKERNKTSLVVKRLLAMQEEQDKGAMAEFKRAMAELRCLLNPNLKHRGWQIVGQMGGIGDFATETTAGLFALHRIHSSENNKNVGSSCRVLRDKSNEDGKNPLDVRFRRLLAADREELPALLQSMFRRMERENISVNYHQLFWDLRRWGDTVRKEWAKEYWSNQQKEGETSHVSE